ncbi:MAG: hypothetical protein ABSF26_31025 [Thermoguttaceae bacterium]|jgi:hypothetical protein
MKFNDPGTLLLVVLAVTAGVLLVKTNRYFARQRGRSGGTGVSPVLSPTSELANAGWKPVPPYAGSAEEVDRFEVQMHDTARQLSARLDTKMLALEALLAEAERAAARLEAAIARSGGAAGHDAHQVPSPPQKGTVPFSSDEDRDSPPRATAAGREVGLVLDFDAHASGPAATNGGGEPLAAGSPAGQARDEIYALAEAGCDAAEIARQTARPIGEVELILSLRGRG